MKNGLSRIVILILLILVWVACSTQENAPVIKSNNDRMFSLEMQKSLLNLHHLQHYKAGKNSFVLGLETICNRPAMLRESGRRILLDLTGTGSLRHIWQTHGPGKSPFILEFYVDGETEPSIRGPFDLLVEAAKSCEQPYCSPGGSTLDYNSYNFYLPVPFEKSLRVELVANPVIGLVFLQLDYRLEDSTMNGTRLVQKSDNEGSMVLTYLPEKSPASMEILEAPATETTSWRFTGDQTIRIGGPAVIRRLGLNSKRRDVRLLIRFDGSDSPSVNVDLADFFGPFRGVALNNNQCYFPMPFGSSAEIEITGSSPHEEWILEVDLEKAEEFEPGWGYFHALHTRVDSSVGYLPFQVLSTGGKGHWVGMSIYDTHHDHGGGDFAVIDANTSLPSFLHGINGEDYFSFAFFGKGENFPYSEAFNNDEGRMRIHLENPYPFEESMAVNWGVTEGLSPRSVAFWYQDTPQDLTKAEPEARGREWFVFGPVTVTALQEDGNSPDLSDLDRLFKVLPDEKVLDAGRTVEAEHIIFSKEIHGNYHGWARQYSSGPFLNLMYVYAHVLNNLGGDHHMGYYARAMMAKTNLRSQQKRGVRIQLSYDDPLQLYLNGTLILADSEIHNGFITRQIEADLEAGENNLLVKILDTPNMNTMWAGIGLRVLEDNGNTYE